MCARHSFRNCCWAADPYTLPIAAPRPRVFWSSAASAILVLADDGLVVTAVCTTLAVRSTCSTRSWSSPAYRRAAAVLVGSPIAGLDEAMCDGALPGAAPAPLPVLEQAATVTATAAAPMAARTRSELRIIVFLSLAQ